MELLDYGNEARKTAIYPNRGQNLPYAILGLIEEAYELKEKMLAGDSEGALLELGDVLWYLVACSDELGLEFSELFGQNITTLEALASLEHRIAVETIAGFALDEAASAGGVVKKIIRDDAGKASEAKSARLRSLLESIAAALSAAAYLLGKTLSDAMEANVKKLSSRKNRGALTGSGDYR